MNRPYQSECIDSIIEEYHKGVHQQLVVMATGTGKTHVFSSLPDELKSILPGQMMVVAHREELIDQAIDTLRKRNPTLKVDKEMANHKCDPANADIIVASVASIGRKDSTRILKFNWERIDKLIVDEAHHAPASSYQNIFECAGVLEPNADKLLLGVTATPNGRGDGKALAATFKKIVYTYGMRQAIEDGWLSDVCGFKGITNTNLDSVKTSGGDFDERSLAEAINTPERNQYVYRLWDQQSGHRQTVGFTVDIQHAKDLAEMFRYYGVKAEAIWGNDPDRAEKLAAHKAGDITVLFNCGILIEGYDDWRIGCILLARPTKSPILFTQMVGRGTRLQEGIGNLKNWLAEGLPLIKKDCIVIDVVDSSRKHSLITLPTLMGMSPNMDLKGRSVVKTIQLIEEKQKEFPNVNFSELKDITKIDTFIEEVNLFDIVFPPEVENNSKLSWHPGADGGFVILMPDKDEIRIRQNALEQWEVIGQIKGKKYKGIREEISDAFLAADNLILSNASEHLKILNREEKWHDDPATVKQLMAIRRYYPGKQLPDNLSKGQASKLISAAKAGKKK